MRGRGIGEGEKAGGAESRRGEDLRWLEAGVA